MTLPAVIAGATSLIGSNLAEHLVSKGWEVYGVARKPQSGVCGVRAIAADFLEPGSLRAALAGALPTHVFFTTWVRRARPALALTAAPAWLSSRLPRMAVEHPMSPDAIILPQDDGKLIGHVVHAQAQAPGQRPAGAQDEIGIPVAGLG